MLPLDQLPYIEYVTDAGDTRRIYADTVMTEDIDATADATRNAVESGAKLSDHIQPNPVDIKSTMLFSEEPIRADLDPNVHGRSQVIPIKYPAYPSNTPLLSPGGITHLAKEGITAGAAALGVHIGTSLPSSYSALKFDSPPGRGRTAYELFMRLREKRVLVAAGVMIGAGITRFENCALVGVHYAKKIEDGTAVPIDLTLQQISFVTTEQAKAVPLPLEPRGQAKPKDAKGKEGEVDKGAQTGIVKGLLNKAGVTTAGSGLPQ